MVPPLEGRDRLRRLVAEALGSALLVAAVVGSGVMATRLSPGEVGLQLLENAFATAGALAGLILTFAAVSGAHFNPAVSLVECLLGRLAPRDGVLYVLAQIGGACAGAIAANVMFSLPAFQVSTKQRSSGPLWFSEMLATVGLLLVINGAVHAGRQRALPFAIGAWIGGAYWFTSSTSFANPAVTVARILSDSFAGIAPRSAPMFVVMQLGGTLVAVVLVRFLFPSTAERSDA